MKFLSRQVLSKSLLLINLALLTSLPVSSETLDAPQALVVKRQGAIFKGSWTAVKRASFYEVWVNSYGRWSFDPKNLSTSPFTSSFELSIPDERSVFKVRAVDSAGRPGAFSQEQNASEVIVEVEPEDPEDSPEANTVKRPGFDPKAQAPESPSSLFAIWVEPAMIKLVWRGPEQARSYSVEELVDGNWTSVPKITFPGPNSALIDNHPAPGPYRFRVRSVGANGRASEPSRPTTAKR